MTAGERGEVSGSGGMVEGGKGESESESGLGVRCSRVETGR